MPAPRAASCRDLAQQPLACEVLAAGHAAKHTLHDFVGPCLRAAEPGQSMRASASLLPAAAPVLIAVRDFEHACFALQDFRAKLVQLMVDANDDASTPAYKQIEEMVEAQVHLTQQVAVGPPCRYFQLQQALLAVQVPVHEPLAGSWQQIHKEGSVSAYCTRITSLHHVV